MRSTSWKRSLLLMMAVAILAVMATACGDDDSGAASGSESTPDEPGEVEAGGEMTVITQSEPRTLDPASNTNANSTGGPVMSAIFGHLFIIDPETQEFVPGIAESLETTDDGTTWELKLRDGVEFSDGSPLDSEAVKFSWERMLDPELASSARGTVTKMTSITAVDPLTLEIVLDEPNPHWLHHLLYEPLQWIVPPAAVEAAGADFANDPVGAGPFILDSRTPGSEMVFRRNPNYWDSGKPNLDELTISFNPDGQQAFDAVSVGQSQAFVNPSDLLVREAEGAGMEVTQFEMIGGVNWLMNAALPPFDDVRARKAVVAAVDPQVINETVFQGAIEWPSPLIPEWSPLHDPIELAEPDVEAAQALFDELAAEGTPVEFTISAATTSESQAMAQSIQTQLATFDNVTVNIEELDAAQWAQKVFAEKSFQMVNAGTNTLDPEPVFFDWWHSSGSRNVTQLNDPDMDAALERGRNATDVETRTEAYAEFVEVLNEQAPAIWVYRKNQSVLHEPDVTGWVLYGNGTPIFDDLAFTS